MDLEKRQDNQTVALLPGEYHDQADAQETASRINHMLIKRGCSTDGDRFVVALVYETVYKTFAVKVVTNGPFLDDPGKLTSLLMLLFITGLRGGSPPPIVLDYWA